MSLMEKAQAHSVSSLCPHLSFVLLFFSESEGKGGQVSEGKVR